MHHAAGRMAVHTHRDGPIHIHNCPRVADRQVSPKEWIAVHMQLHRWYTACGTDGEPHGMDLGLTPAIRLWSMCPGGAHGPRVADSRCTGLAIHAGGWRTRGLDDAAGGSHGFCPVHLHAPKRRSAPGHLLLSATRGQHGECKGMGWWTTPAVPTVRDSSATQPALGR